MKIHVKVISSRANEILAAITDESKSARRADLRVTMQTLMPHPPFAGAMVDVIGILSDHAPQPFLFHMTQGELAASLHPRPAR